MDPHHGHHQYVPLVMPHDMKPAIMPTSQYAHPPPMKSTGMGVHHAAHKIKKPARDPGAPKRNLSAYLLYQNAMREQFKAQNPGMSFGQLSKYTSAMYAQLTPEEKAAWQARADADKARYEHDLATYAPPPGYDQRGEQIIVVAKHKKGRMHKDTNAPKKNVSAYLLYQNAMRDKFKRDNPGMSFGQLSKYTSHMYKNLSPEEKAAWEQVAQQDKERFEAEMAAYEPPPGHDSRGVLFLDEGHLAVGRKRKRPRDPQAPKRNKGSFVLFAEEERPRIKSEYPDIKFTDMGVILGERWRALLKGQKERYEAMANEDKARFAHEMDDYNRQHGILAEQQHAMAAYGQMSEGPSHVASHMGGVEMHMQMNPALGMYQHHAHM